MDDAREGADSVRQRLTPKKSTTLALPPPPAVASDTDNAGPIPSSGSILTCYSSSSLSYACHIL
jgi:hypothetical protein